MRRAATITAMNDAAVRPTRALHQRRYIPWLILLAAIALIAGLVLLIVGKRRRNDQRLFADEVAEALAEQDRLDPGWRLEEIEKNRPALADDVNSARCIEAVLAQVPNGWPTEGETPVSTANLRPPEPFPPEMLAIIGRELGRIGPALAEA
jgi:hypothetical protein